MPRELRFLDGRSTYAPTPLETARITRVVERYRGQLYKIFVDESFRSYFGFERPTGYLCYGAVGIPEKEYIYLKRSMAKIFSKYERYVTGDPDVRLSEFKFDRFKSLSPDERRDLARQIQRVLKAYGCFITAFYIRTQGAAMEHVRSDLVGQLTEIPEDYQSLYEKAVNELKENASEGFAQSETIASVLRIPLSGLSHFMAYFECPYQILCDPREAKEDKAVLAAIDAFFSGPMDAIAPTEARLYKGMDNTIASEDEVGLQLADLLTGEVRMFFELNPEFLTDQSSRTLVTSSSREEIEMWTTAMGIYHKYGSLSKIPQKLMEKLESFSCASCLPIYRPSFAAGLLSLYTDFGQPRHIELYEGNFFQQID